MASYPAGFAIGSPETPHDVFASDQIRVNGSLPHSIDSFYKISPESQAALKSIGTRSLLNAFSTMDIVPVGGIIPAAGSRQGRGKHLTNSENADGRYSIIHGSHLKSLPWIVMKGILLSKTSTFSSATTQDPSVKFG